MATTDQRAGFRLPWSSDQRPQANETATEGADQSAADTAVRGHHVTAGPGSADHLSTETQPMSADAPIDSFASATGSLSAWARASSAAGRRQGLRRGDPRPVRQRRDRPADAKAFVEEIHARSASDVTDLRKEADDDVAGIRDWSKAEIARIREETEVRITDRKAELEGQLERHAGVIESEIDRIQGQVTGFEEEMAYFFEKLLTEEDPTKFAVMAENLPEAPRFQARTIDFRARASQATTSAVAEPPVKPEPTSRPAESVGAADAVEEPDRDAGFVATGPAFETAARSDAQDTQATAVAERSVEAEAPERATDYADPWRDTRVQAADKVEALDATDGTKAATHEADATRAEEMTGTSLSGFDAAEAEAAAAAETTDDEIPTMSDDALAARLAGLVPNRATTEERPAKSADTATTTQVVVVGLVSVASIASFKRHLGRIPGVQSVGVSSGPDGEFVFAVNHSGDVSLRDVVPTVPGFQARVTNAGDGVVNVTAHDPESEG